MSESIPLGLKRAAIALAQESDYEQAAVKLKTTVVELREQIAALEACLCLHIFDPNQPKVAPTDEGRFLIKAFRDAIEAHDRNQNGTAG